MLNPNNHTLHEALSDVAEAPTREEKVQRLHKWDSYALTSPAVIQKQVKNNFKYFAKGGAGENMMAPKREKMFMQMLSIVHPDDAPLLVAMKDKKFQGLYKGVTKLAVQEAWPSLIKD